MRIATLLLIFTFGITFQSFGQHVTGTVTDSQTDDPLVGVNILVVGTSIGTTTDKNGHYSLNVPSRQDTLRFSFIGYLNKFKAINNRSEIDIFLEPTSTSLEQLVVVGYGTQKKKNLVGSVSQVQIEDMTNRANSGTARDLQGTIPGLNIKHRGGSQGADPGSPYDLNIRGFTSINGGSPLVLVNGIEEDLYYVNPNNIESVTVLKDAEAAAIYGSRGAYGVILIKTKQAKPGHFKVEYSNNIGSSTTIQRTDFITNPYLYGKYVDAAIYPRAGANAYTQWTTDEMWEAAKEVGNGEREPFMKKMNDGTYRFFYNTDWWHVMHRKWQKHQAHNLSVSGGSKTLNARFTARIFNRTKLANFHDADVDRYNLSLNANYNPYKWLKLTFGQRFTKNREERIGGNKNGYASQWSVSAMRDKFAFYPAFVDGQPTDIGRSHNGYTGRLGALVEGANWRKYIHKNYVARLAAELTPLKGLELNFNWNYNWNNYNRPTRARPFFVLQGNRLNPVTEGQSNYAEYRNNTYYQATNLYGSYSLPVGKEGKNHFKLMLGLNWERSLQDHISARMNDLLSPKVSDFSVGTEMYNIDGSTTDWGLLGYFGRFNYDFKGKYLLQLNARYDGSSRFPKENRWGFFPSVGVGWRISKEKFWKNSSVQNVISSLKVRGSYGSLGNQTVPVNTFRQLIGLGKTSWLVNGERVNYARIPSPLPAHVSWETVTSTDIGVDIGFLENKITATFDWYQRETSNMYLPGQPLPAVFGASAPRTNYAALKNRGFEIELKYNNSFNIWGSTMALNVSANVSNFRGYITKYRNPNGLLSGFYEGEELGTLWGYHVEGQFLTDEEARQYEAQHSDPNVPKALGQVYYDIVNKSAGEWGHLKAGDVKYADLNGDGIIGNGANTLSNHGDLKKIGNAMPHFPFGFKISAAWKGIDLTIVARGIGHQDWYPTSQMFWDTFARPYASYLRKDLYAHVWNPDLSTEENVKHGNIYPQIYRGYAANSGQLQKLNDFYLKNIGYLRLKNLTIGYTLPREITNKVKIQKLRVFVSGENLWTIRFGGLTHYVDPSVVGGHISYSDPGEATNLGNKSYFYYPQFMTLSAGVQIQF
jgi:TonB-linked SusC/RagA family outer membrane protein